MITHIDRYGFSSKDYIYYVHYDNGHFDQIAEGGLSKDAKAFMARASFQFVKCKNGRYFHRWK